MLDFVIQKMLNRKWIVLCLLVGNILLVGIACCNPMYMDAVQQKTLNRNMSNYIIEKNRYPGTISLSAQLKINGDKNTAEQFTAARDAVKTMQKELPVPAVMEIYHYCIPKMEAQTDYTYNGEQVRKKLTVGYLQDLKDHVKMVSGEFYRDEAGEDGVIDAIISQKGLVSQKLLVGETLTFMELRDKKGDPLRVRICGVFENSEDEDLFWVNSPSSFTSEILISEKIFNDNFVNYEDPAYEMRGTFYLLLDYEQIRGANVETLLSRTKEYVNEYSQISSVTFRSLYQNLLEEHQTMVRRVVSTLRILQVPILVLLAAFIFMVSRQILEIEKNDIAILKSRGASKKQLIISYLIQGSILAGIGFVLGIPLAIFLCQMFGSANSFLGFVQRSALHIRITPGVLLYGLAAVVLSVIAMTMPVFKYADLTIVEHKQKQSDKKKKVWWQKYFLDVLLLAVSLYGLYSFHNQQELLVQRVTEGGALDPLLYLSSSLFIIGAGLLALRIIPLFLTLIFKLGKKRWNPSWYASFLRVLRTKNKQYFIMVFLTLTIALGIFNAKSARTINEGEEERISYAIGADVVLQERWSDEEEPEEGSETFEDEEDPDEENQGEEGTDGEGGAQQEEAEPEQISADDYTEPDIEKYSSIENVVGVTKVYTTNDATISVESTVDAEEKKEVPGGDKKKQNENREQEGWGQQQIMSQNIQLMGIQTKGFGETAWFNEELLPTHWYYYLNAISQNASAVLVSSNFRDELGYQLGDELTYRTVTGQSVKGMIFGFVDYWPTYQPTETETADDGTKTVKNRYLVVANLQKLQNVDGVLPYQVWLRVDGSTQPIYDFIGDKEIKLVSFSDRQADLIDMKNEPIIQGTNGILTVGFIVVLLLCGVGFLIYWIISIQSRALQFGIFRAMGMTMRELMVMLIGEQLFITLPAVLMGTGIGLLASKLYIPLIQIAYQTAQSPLPSQVESAGSDIVKMFIVVLVVVGVCMAALGWLISKIKISQALKLGED